MTSVTCPRCSSVYPRQRHHAGNPANICATCRQSVRKKRVVLQRRVRRMQRDLLKLRHYGSCMTCGRERTHDMDCPVWLMTEALDALTNDITQERKTA